MLINKFSRMTNFFSFSAIAFLVPFLLLGASAEAATRADVKKLVIEEAELTKVPPSLALAIAKVESNFRDYALGTQGERGVMQIMPSTARGEFGVPVEQLWNGRLNINLGLKYLENLYEQYGGRWHLALSHYNGGTLKGRGANAIPHSYTREYVTKVLGWKNTFERRNTVAQLKQSVVISRKSSPPSPSAAPLGYSSVDYWMFNNPEVVKGWRHYMHVANFWLKSEEERALILVKTRNQSFKAVSADSGEVSGGTQVAAKKAKRKAAVVTYNSYHVDAENDWPLGNSTQARPSDRWKKSATRLRKSFQRHIRAYGNL